jgi:hypothetical protein
VKPLYKILTLSFIVWGIKEIKEIKEIKGNEKIRITDFNHLTLAVKNIDSYRRLANAHRSQE